MKTNKCTKCPNDLDPHPSEARYRRCRRCREETTRTQRRQGVKPKTGQDEICPLCDGVMIDSRFESCEACRFGPRVITLSGRRCKDQKSSPTSNQDSTNPNAASSGTSGFATTPYVYPDLPPPPATLYSTSLPSQNHRYNTPSNGSGSNLSLTPLSFAGSFGSESPYTSWDGTPCSAYGKQAPLPPPDSPLGSRLSPIHTCTISGPGRAYNTYPQSASAPTYPHPLPHDPDRGGSSTFNYVADSRLRASPIFFSTPLQSVPLPEPDSRYIDYDYDPAIATAPTTTSAYSPRSSPPLDIIDPIYHEQPVLLQNSACYHDRDVGAAGDIHHSSSIPPYAAPVSDGHGGVDADINDPNGTAKVRAGYFLDHFSTTAPGTSFDSNSNSNVSENLPTQTDLYIDS